MKGFFVIKGGHEHFLVVYEKTLTKLIVWMRH
jgi:hypothetical protein